MQKHLLPSLAAFVVLITLAGAPNPAARAQADAAAVPADATVILSDAGMWR